MTSSRSIGAALEVRLSAGGDEPAVRSVHGTTSYAELAERCAAVAARVAELEPRAGEPPPRVVVLCAGLAERVAALGGTWLGGGVCVPLDPDHPAEHLRAVVADSGASLLLGDERGCVAAARHVPDVPLVDVARLASRGGGHVHTEAGADETALLLYTSGTTGVPKGVQHTHGGLLHSWQRQADALRLDASDRVLQAASAGYVAALSETMMALLTGAALVPARLADLGLAELLGRVRAEGVTVLRLAPTLFRAACAVGEAPPSVRVVRLGGEPVRWSDVSLFHQLYSPPARLVVAYGCTETGLIAQHEVDRPRANERGTVPVGHPLPGMCVEVCDEEGRPAAPDEPGRLLVKSAHLALGYWRRPELTARAFRAGDSGERVFDTGDLGSRAADGLLRHLGRRDRQVQINGHRVECAATEDVLLGHPDVRDAAVLPEETGTGPRLVAYLVGREPGDRDLRDHLGRLLPSAAIPTRYRWIPEIPRTAHGKLDPARLPREGSGAARGAREGLTPAESLIADIWREVLDVRPGRHESFFDVGGDSLRGMTLWALLGQRFGVELPFGQLGTLDTVARQAAHLDHPDARLSLSPLLELRASDAGRALVCLPGVGGHGWLFRHLARELEADVAVYALNHPGLDGDSVPLDSVEAVATVLLEELRRGLAADTACAFLGYSFGGRLALDLARRARRAGMRVLGCVQVDGNAPGHEPRAPLDRLVRRGTRLWHSFRHGRPDAGGRPPAGAVEERLLRLQQVTRRASRRYRPEPFDAGPILLVSTRPAAGGSDHGWQDWSATPLRSHRIAAPHLDVLFPPHVTAVARVVEEWLAGLP